jgi:glycosyltransferase involved in cell wall biosynthesis
MISVVVPAYNEEQAITETVRSLKAVIQDARLGDAEIVVVDDGSTDRTGDAAREAGAKVVRHAHNLGYGRALKTGIEAAAHDTVVIIDADRTYPAARLPDLLAEYHKGYDMVVGARTGHHYSGGVFKGPLRYLFKWLVEFTTGRSVPDANSGFRVFSRATMQGYAKTLCDTFSFTTSLTLAYLMSARCVHYVPIEYNGRVGQTKVRLLRDTLRTGQYIVQAIIYYNPMKIFLLLSGVCVAMAVLGFATGAATGMAAPYYLGIGGLLVSVLVFSLGLLADLLRQIMVK